MILSTVDLLPIVQEIVELPAVDLVERYMEGQVLVALQVVADVEGSQEVQPWVLSVLRAHHSVSFSTTGLAIGKASRLSPCKGALNQWLYTDLVDLLWIS